MTAKEYKRQFRVLDMMLSAHSELRDRYRRRATALTLLMMAAAIAATTLALSAGDDQVEILGISAKGTEWLAGLGAAVFLLAMVELLVGWRERSWGHDAAAARLGELKAQFRRARIDGNRVETDGVDLTRAYDEAMNAIVEIPNHLFNRLKAKHRRKVAISQMLDDRSGLPPVYVRWLLFRQHLSDRQDTEHGGVGQIDFETGEVLEESPPGSVEPSEDDEDVDHNTGNGGSDDRSDPGGQGRT